MIEKTTATAAIILLLQFFILSCDSQNLHSQCKNQTCHVFPDNFGHLQKIISSNQLIILNGEEFSVDESIGSILIENVFNLTISGGERGSLIECSPNSTFGLYLKNATNITLNEITMINCASYTPNHMMIYKYLSQNNESTILIDTSSNINLSKVDIHYSPGIALAIFDSMFSEPVIDNMNTNLTLNSCTFSHSREGSLFVLGTTSLVIESTVIANCSRGIESYKANIKIMKGFDVNNCTSSSLEAGHVEMVGILRIVNSSLTVAECNILFTCDRFLSGLVFIQNSTIYVTENSVLYFRRYNSSVIELMQSILTLDRESIMIFTQSSADSGIISIYLFYSHMHVVNGSTLSITNNTLTNKSAMLVFSYSSFVVSSGILLLENNEFQSSYLILASNASIIWEQGSLVNFTNNTLQYQSYIFYHLGGFMDFKNSFLVITNNSVTEFSTVLYYEVSTLTLSAAKLLLENNKCMFWSGLVVSDSLATRFEMRTLINSTHNEVYDISTIICFTRTSSESFNMSLVTIKESTLVMTNNSINNVSTGFLCGQAICVLSGVEFLFKGNECDQRFCALMGSSYGIMLLEKGSIVNFTHNKIYRLSSIFKIFKAHLYVDESSLSITNNLLDTSYGFWCRHCVTIVLSSVVLLFRENDCETCCFMQIYEITTRFENHSLVTVTHNKMEKNGYFIYSVGVYLVISESSVIVTDNSLIHTQALLYFMNSSLTLSSGKLILENIKCQKWSKLMEAIDTSIKMENNFFVKFADNEMDKCLLFLYNQTS